MVPSFKIKHKNSVPRGLFPVTKDLIYFNHAATGPMSLPARKAIEECLDIYSRQAEFPIDEYFMRLKNARTLIAHLIGAAPEEIAFTHNTSEGIYISLINLPLKEGDRVLIMEEVFPAVRYVIDYNLPYVEKRYIPFSGRDVVQVVKENLDKRVKAVVVDLAQYLNGEMVDIRRLSNFLKENGIYCVVDGVQAIGTVDFDVHKTEVDFLACGAAKWLFGPGGTGFLFVNKKSFKFLKKLHTGWLGAAWQDFENFGIMPPLFSDARMFEQGTRNLMGISAFCENVKILLEFGLKNVQRQILALKSNLRHKFKELNYEIITPEKGPQSGIITVKHRDAKSMYERLYENKIAISLRNNCLRFSPHFYNTEEEVDRIFKFLRH